MRKVTKLALLINVTIFMVDRLIKHRATQGLVPFSQNNKLFFLNVSQNLTVIISLTIITVLLVFLTKKLKGKDLLLIACGSIILGGISNLYDRITLGFVIDYLPLFSFSQFNLSDALISFGCFLIAIRIIKDNKKTKTEKHCEILKKR